MERLKINDRVSWRGAWGTDAPKEAVVVDITLCPVNKKYGRYVKSASWETVKRNKIVVTLDNGHWAYGYQIRPLGVDF